MGSKWPGWSEQSEFNAEVGDIAHQGYYSLLNG